MNMHKATTFDDGFASQLAAPARLLAGLASEMRPKQWIKNLTCLAGLVFSGQLFDVTAVAMAWVGFAAFCAASSSIYILNDLVDLHVDRCNPRTRTRPLASGDLPVWLAVAASICLAIVSLFTAGSLNLACAVVLTMYLLLNVLYSTHLKHAVIADVMCIALGFVLRVLLGVYAVQVLPTAWIVICMFFLAIFLGFAKRKSELSNAEGDASLIRPVLTQYTAPLLDILLAMSATTAIVCYGLFTVTSSRNPTLIVTVVPVAFCVMRYLLHVIVHGKGDSPETILMSDKPLWLGIAAWLVLCVGILYGEIHLFAEVSAWAP